MDVTRMAEIMTSPHNISVMYRNQPVWIESLNEIEQTAAISYIGSGKSGETVPVGELVEM